MSGSGVRPNTEFDWDGTAILRGDLATELDALRRGSAGGDGEIIAHGGVSFARSLVKVDAVDEYRLTVFSYAALSS